MKSAEITVEDAFNFLKKSKNVLVTYQDLECEREVTSFVTKPKSECNNIIYSAKTLVYYCDEFIREIILYTHEQPDIDHTIPVGQEIIILF